MWSLEFGVYLTCLFNLDLPYERTAGESGGKPAYRPGTAEIIGALHSLQEKMLEYFQLDVSCSIGTVVSSLDDISESYEAALTAAFFQMTREKGAVLRYSELAALLVETQDFPVELSRDILDAIKNWDKGRIRNGISEFFGCISHYRYYHAVKCLQLLELEISRLEMKYGIYHEDVEGYVTERIYGKRLYGLQEAFLARALGVSDRYKEKRENNPNMKQIVEQVKALVEDNLTQKDLSVTFVAQKLYLSTNYVRGIFKEVTGEPLSSYIIAKRLEKICALLQETDWSGQQIADYMGFTTKSYFYTFFKNYMGMTPNQYRKNGSGERMAIHEIDVEEN